MRIEFSSKRWWSASSPFGPWFVASIVLVLLGMWSVFAWIAVETYRNEWDNAELLGNSVTALLEQSIARNIELFDLSLQAVVEDANDPRILALAADLRHKVLYDSSANAHGLGSIVLVDKKGKVIDDSRDLARPGLDVSDREYFTAQRDGLVGKQPFISHPFKSRITGHTGIALSRRLNKPDGDFDGVVMGQMTSAYLKSLLETVRLLPESSITLLCSDGTILMRVPDERAGVGLTIRTRGFADFAHGQPFGRFVKYSAYDGVERLYTYRQIGILPIYLMTGLSTEIFLEPWRRRVIMVALGFTALSGIILFLGFTLVRELRRRSRAEQTLSALAATDALTHLPNRRRFDEVLDIEWRRGIRESTPLALLMIDGDFFKAYNDTYGHVEGDHALRTLADALKTCIERPGDLAARFGGEEFAVLLPGTDQEGGGRIAAVVRQAVAALALPHLGSPMGFLTVSIGVAAQRPMSQQACSSLVEAADDALYAAKAAGRDRIAFSGDQGAVRFGWQRTRSSRVA